MRRHRIATLLAFALLVGACSGRAPSGSPSGTSPPTTQGPLDGCVPTGQASLVDLGGGHQAAVLGGGSEGAKASLIAATTLQPPPAAVVSLSAERTLQGTDVLPAAAKLRAPVLFVTARDDSLVGDATGQLYRAATRSASRRLEVVAGDAHGTGLLGGAAGAKLQATLVGFLRGHGSAATTTTAAAAGSAVSARCGPPVAAASLIHFRATDGTRLDGALVGSGRTGVVLLHQYPNNLCGFWP